MKKFGLFFICLFSFGLMFASEGRTTISLNGEWQFDQTETAFPPKKFTRKIPVPGLIHLATPRVSQYDKFFKKPPTETEMAEQYNFLELDYTPMYNWYRKSVKIDKQLDGQELYLTIKKSQYVTMVYVNGILAGRSIDCYTPIDVRITDAIRFGEENEILIQVGDRAWLPSEAAGSTDKEKIRYLPGIWDDVFITATGTFRVDKALFLPSLKEGKVTVKTLIRNNYPPQMLFDAKTNDSCRIEFTIKEKASGKTVAAKAVSGISKRDNRTCFEAEIPIANPTAWSPDNPFLYTGEVSVFENGQLSDTYSVPFGIRDFSAKGKYFYLNDEKFLLRGSNITLQRFFEDPECGDLVWNREWVKKLMIDLPKSIGWNAMRICVGVVPDFWYDLCDEYGIVLQNEWFFWQLHGWDDQIKKEYTNWVWSDGNHPSIVIWDAINENWDDYIGNILVPELKQLDPTRLWDTGFMTADQMGKNDEMDEPHPYMALSIQVPPEKLTEYYNEHPYNLGELDNWRSCWHKDILDAGVPQLINEYGWIWLWRDGRPAKLTVNNYNHFVGENASPEACRELQAYWLQLETEWIRAERSFAGVLAFCHLTNNYGFTGDWFINRVKDLEVSPTFKWFKHAFAPEAVFINLVDERYMKQTPPRPPGSDLLFNLVGVNDFKTQSEGKVVLRLLDSNGKEVLQQNNQIKIDPYGSKYQPTRIQLPQTEGGYLLLAEYYPNGATEPVISRRYLKVGSRNTDFRFYEFPIN